jgi:hypothetical protein
MPEDCLARSLLLIVSLDFKKKVWDSNRQNRFPLDWPEDGGKKNNYCNNVFPE